MFFRAKAVLADMSPYDYLFNMADKHTKKQDSIHIQKLLDNTTFCMQLFNDPSFRLNELCQLLTTRTTLKSSYITMLVFGTQLHAILEKNSTEAVCNMVMFLNNQVDKWQNGETTNGIHINFKAARLGEMMAGKKIEFLKQYYSTNGDMRLEQLTHIESIKQLKLALEEVSDFLYKSRVIHSLKNYSSFKCGL